MTWEIIAGLITLSSFLVAAGGVLVRLIRTLTSLENAVRELRDFISRQSAKNEFFYKELNRLDRAINSIDSRTKRLEEKEE